MAREKEPVARMAKLLEYGKTVSGHNWYKFFDLWLEAILLRACLKMRDGYLQKR